MQKRHLQQILPTFQYPYPVRVPASIAAIREDGTLLSKSHVSVPLKYVAASASMMRPLPTSKMVDTQQQQQPLPSPSESTISGLQI